MVNPRQVVRPVVFALLLSVFSAASVSVAYGQFTLTVSSPLSPSALDPGGSSIATLDLEPNGSNNAVSLTTIPCTVTPVQPTVQCTPSPDSAIPPAKPSLTVTTTGATPPGLYIITVTGTSGAASQTLTLTLTVVDVTEDYTLSVSPTTATPSTVSAGNVATTTVTVSPIGSYTGSVTLACLSVTPIVTAAPVCSFQPTTGTGPVQVVSNTPATATLTITTLGPTPTTRLRNRRIFYALWLLLPGLALVGAGGSRDRRKRLMGVLLLIAVANGLLLMPACGSTNHTNNPNGEVTPNNTYTFTLTGADANGVPPSNSTTCQVGVACGAATVTLTVN
jgi:hypothetical protein